MLYPDMRFEKQPLKVSPTTQYLEHFDKTNFNQLDFWNLRNTLKLAFSHFNPNPTCNKSYSRWDKNPKMATKLQTPKTKVKTENWRAKDKPRPKLKTWKPNVKMQKIISSQQVFSNNILIQKLTQAVLRSSFKHHPNKTHQTLSRYYPSSRQTHLNADLIQTSSKVDKISYELIWGYINNLVSLEQVLFQIQLGNQIGGRPFWGKQQSQQVCFLVLVH